VSFEDLREGIAELFGEWEPDIEAMLYATYKRRLARDAERSRIGRELVRRTPKERAAWMRECQRAWRARLRQDPVRFAEYKARHAACETARRRAAGAKPRVPAVIEDRVCACGCGEGFRVTQADPQRFVGRHASRLQGTTLSGLLAALATGPKTLDQLVLETGKRLQVLAPTLSKLKKAGKAVRVRSRVWALAAP
jgi:hypothetical protein